jgi:hypothetical protein
LPDSHLHKTSAWNICAKKAVFAAEPQRLREFAADGRGILTATGLETTSTGGFIIRQIVSVFDTCRKLSEPKAFSKAI